MISAAVHQAQAQPAPPMIWTLPAAVIHGRSRVELLELAGGLVRGAHGLLALAGRLSAAGQRSLAVDCLGQALELARAAARLRRIAGGKA